METPSDVNVTNGELRFCTCNMCSIAGPSKITELSYFVKNASINVLTISETWLNASIPDQMISIEGYHLPIRRDRAD